MKKIMIAVFAVMSAASFAGAEDAIDFDGSKGFAQSLHSIFAQNHQILPDTVVQELAQADKKIMPDPFERTCCGVPIGPMDTCYMICPEDDMPDWLKSAPQPAFKRLSFYGSAQEEMKKAGSSYYSAKGQAGMAAAFAARESVVSLDGTKVSLAFIGSTYSINDAELAAEMGRIERQFGSGEARAMIVDGSQVCWGPNGPEACPLPPHGETRGLLEDMTCLGPHGPQPCPTEPLR